MAALGNQTLANEYTSYYLRAGSIAGGVPSPFAVVDESGGIRGSKVVISSADDVGRVTNYDASGNTLGVVSMNAAGNVSLLSSTPPSEGYNLQVRDNQTRVTQPLIVQSGTTGGAQVTNNAGLGTAVFTNSITVPGSNQATVVCDQNGNVVVGGAGTGTVNSGGLKVYTVGGTTTYSQLANPGSQQCIQSTPNDIRFLDSASVNRGGIKASGTTNTQVYGHGVQVITNSDVTPFVAAAFDASGGFTTYSNVTLGAGAGVVGTLSVNGGIDMDDGTTLNGPGTINMKNSSGFSTGTINGVFSMPTAGVQPIQIPGYNPGFPTPLIQFNSTGAITNANYTQASLINDVTLNNGGVGLAGTSSGNSFLVSNLFQMFNFTAPSGDASGGGAITVWDFANKPAGNYYVFVFTGEGGIGVVYTTWTGSAILTPSVNYVNNGYQNKFDVPKNGTSTQIGYAYFSHATTGYGVSFVVRTA